MKEPDAIRLPIVRGKRWTAYFRFGLGLLAGLGSCAAWQGMIEMHGPESRIGFLLTMPAFAVYLLYSAVFKPYAVRIDAHGIAIVAWGRTKLAGWRDVSDVHLETASEESADEQPELADGMKELTVVVVFGNGRHQKLFFGTETAEVYRAIKQQLATDASGEV